MLKTIYRFKFKGVMFEPGKLYSFRYRKFEQDPEPFIMFYNYISGTHPNTGMMWNVLQGVNLHYVTLTYRRKLIKALKVMPNMKAGGLSFNKLLTTIPGIQFAFRRYTAASTYINIIKPIDDGIVELTKNPKKHDKMLIPKGLKLKDLQHYVKPRSFSQHKKRLKKKAAAKKKGSKKVVKRKRK